MEAYDVDADAATMLDPEWSNVPLSYRATDWSGWNIEENWFGVNKISVEQALILDSMKK